MVRRIGAAVNFDLTSIQSGVRPGAGQSGGIYVSSNDETCTTSSRDPSKHAAASPDIEDGVRLALAAQQIDRRRAESRCGMRAIPKHHGRPEQLWQHWQG
jgi:hypothetical protein